MPLFRTLQFLVALITVLRLAIVPAEAAPQHAATEQVRAELRVAVDAVHPGEEILLGIRQQIVPHWHTYWINPGDSGIATRIAWKLPPGAQAGDIQWPVPSRFQSGPLVNFAYENEATLLVPIRVPSGATIGSLFPIAASVDWLVCREDCIPQQVELGLVLPITAPETPRRESDPLIEAARRHLPVASPWPIRVEAVADRLSLRVAHDAFAAETIRDVRFYPSEWGRIAHSAVQTWQVDARGIALSLTPGEAPASPGEPLRGVLVISQANGGSPISRGYAIDTELAGETAAADVGLVTALLLALLGGVVLNLMPCVFPVLSIKALSLLQHAQQSPHEARRQGIAYTLGVLASFILLASLLIVLKAGGSRVGWGFQFQSPLFVLAVADLVFAVGLSLSGVFSVGVSVTGVGSALADRPGYAGSFFTGVLATIVATPCTAPFMAAAVGFALTQPAAVLLGVFVSLGCGLALPYLLLSTWPALQRRLPRPGPWMERTRQLLAFPMYGTTVWLLWVLAQQVGSGAIGVALCGMVALAFAAWLYDTTRHARASLRRAGAGVAALTAALAVFGGLSGVESGAPATALRNTRWEAYGAARLAELRRTGKPVFLNFTAAWCISCLINERVALSDAAVAEAFREADMAYLKGDWTNRDPAITAKLAEFGRSGVPLYVYFPPGGTAAPVVLPQILTPRIVLDTIQANAPIATHHP